jgi:hypothetical protein
MFTISKGVDPRNYLSCLVERNRALHLHDRATSRLCTVLSCPRRNLDMVILNQRGSRQMPERIRSAIEELNQADILLDRASTLLEIAEDIRTARVNTDLQNIDC